MEKVCLPRNSVKETSAHQLFHAGMNDLSKDRIDKTLIFHFFLPPGSKNIGSRTLSEERNGVKSKFRPSSYWRFSAHPG